MGRKHADLFWIKSDRVQISRNSGWRLKWEPSLGLHTAHAYFVNISIWFLFWYSATPSIFTFIVHLRTSNKLLSSSTFSIRVTVTCITLKICYTNFKLMPIDAGPRREIPSSIVCDNTTKCEQTLWKSLLFIIDWIFILRYLSFKIIFSFARNHLFYFFLSEPVRRNQNSYRLTGWYLYLFLQPRCKNF